MPSCLIIGGGVVGLSLAYELARRGWRVTIVDCGPLGREASWAGAGILPPANAGTALHPLDQLRALSNDLHEDWAQRLLIETAIDTGFRRCGGLYLARTAGEAAALAAMAQTLREEQIACRLLSASELKASESALAHLASSGDLRAAYELPDECQLRNPRHLKALAAACRRLGVEIHEHCEVTEIIPADGQVIAVRTPRGNLTADAFAITAGPWTERILAREHVSTGIFPMRGQMVLFRCERPPFRRVLNEGPRYLVPRDDGYVLAGSTEEEAGFDKSTTSEAIAELSQFAINLVPTLHDATIEQTWAGLRPASYDGFPYIGRMPGLENAFVAAGHFRSGLHLSPGTAVVLADLMCGAMPSIDLSPFRVSRG
jgi:glycine oxidase